MKSAFYKTVGEGQLSWEELGEVILDVEVTLNGRPLCYQEEDVQLPTLTPNTLLFLNTNILPELPPHQLDDKDLCKRAKFLLRTKDALWRRWTAEYLRAFRERHRLKHGDKKCTLAVLLPSWNCHVKRRMCRETRHPSILQLLCLDLDEMQQLQPGFECRK